MTAKPFWISVEGPELRQGDLLPGCLVPLFHPEFDAGDEAQTTVVDEFDLIVLTQSCDLENKKARVVALCPIYSIAVFEQGNESFRKKGAWENVRKGRLEGLHLLASPEHPENNREALVVDLQEVHSLPIGYLSEHAKKVGPRWRLKSPYLEHFSQSFARFFMRVGLPSAIPPYK